MSIIDNLKGECMSYTDFDFPHTHMYESDLRELLAKMKKLEETVKNFVNLEQLKFADPITWNITTQYQKGTIVIDAQGNAYISKEIVPMGVQLDNTDYWLEIFNFMDYIKSFNSNLTVNIESNTNRATSNYIEDDWLVLNDILYEVTSNIAIDDLFIIYPNTGYNIKHFTIEDFIKVFTTWATSTINQYKDDIDASELTYQAAMQAEVDRILAGATVDSEVIDARLGADGVNYTTLGLAIRTQFYNLTHGLTGGLVPMTFAPSLTLDRRWNKTNGSGQTGAKYCRTNLMTVAGVMSAFSLSDSNTYEYYLTIGDSTYAGSGAGFIRATENQSGIFFIPDDAARIGITFHRLDDAVMADSDITAITALIKAYTLTDNTMTLANKAADAKAVGDAFNEVGDAFDKISEQLGCDYDISGVTWETGTINSSGNVITSGYSTNRASDFIAVLSPSIMFIPSADIRSGRFIAGYNNDKTFIGTIGGNDPEVTDTETDIVIQIPAGVSYIRITRHEDATITDISYVNAVKMINDAYNETISKGTTVTGTNKSRYFTDANDAPLNKIFRLSTTAEIDNTPLGNGVSDASTVYDGSLGYRQIAGYLTGTLITYGSSDAVKHQIFISHRTVTQLEPTVMYYRSYYNNEWSIWHSVGNKVSPASTNIAIRRRMICEYLDANGDPVHTDGGYGANPQYMGNDPVLFDDCDDAPNNSIYQLDLDLIEGIMYHNPFPGKSSTLITTGSIYSSRHAMVQMCIGLDTGNDTLMAVRYSYLSGGTVNWTNWKYL